jgi:hypothetical protein
VYEADHPQLTLTWNHHSHHTLRSRLFVACVSIHEHTSVDKMPIRLYICARAECVV